MAKTDLPGLKPIAEGFAWGEMQSGPDAQIDCQKLDDIILEYQNQGFTKVLIALKSHSKWASINIPGTPGNANAAPKDMYKGHYQAWIRTIVKRYTIGSSDQLPGLRWSIDTYEIGSEFSSFEPESATEYVDMLKLAYAAAKDANPNVKIAHAAFLVTPVPLGNVDMPSTTAYNMVFDMAELHDETHDLEDMRFVLDNHAHFDLINVHNLGSPEELEHIKK